MILKRRLAAIAVGGLMALTAVSVAAAASNGHGQGQSRRDKALAYWTADRIAHAVPRDYVLDTLPPGFTMPQAPGGKGQKPGGGGDGSGTAVTGASWNGGGLVKLTTGKVLFNLSGTDYVCSGSVVDDGSAGDSRSLVLTAGHCVFDEINDEFATNWVFMPDFDDSSTGSVWDCASAPYGCWVADALVTTQAWANSDFNEDYAFAVMYDGGHAGNASLESVTGIQPIVFNQPHPATVYAFGYPHASPYDGTDLTYCAGVDQADNFGSTSYGLKCDMTGGSSGGPWMVNFDEAAGAGSLNSLNSFKYRGGKQKNLMFGPYFDGYTQATYNAAKSATANSLITQ
jgi:hypothetical protein